MWEALKFDEFESASKQVRVIGSNKTKSYWHHCHQGKTDSRIPLPLTQSAGAVEYTDSTSAEE